MGSVVMSEGKIAQGVSVCKDITFVCMLSF